MCAGGDDLFVGGDVNRRAGRLGDPFDRLDAGRIGPMVPGRRRCQNERTEDKAAASEKQRGRGAAAGLNTNRACQRPIHATKLYPPGAGGNPLRAKCPPAGVRAAGRSTIGAKKAAPTRTRAGLGAAC